MGRDGYVEAVEVPEGLVALQTEHGGVAGRAFLAALPGRAAEVLRRWELRRTGPAMHGWTALVLPVERADGTPAVLKLWSVDEENAAEPDALRIWDGDGAVRLLDHDPVACALLLERLSTRSLSAVPDPLDAARTIAELLARLTARPAPAGVRRLGDIAARMLEEAPAALRLLADEDERRLLRRCADVLREVADEPGDRLLHWDLHYDNVLAADREPWLAIDPKPLAGDPGFELLPALVNRFDPAGVLPRFDLMTEVLGLDRARARAWTLARVLQRSLWDLEDGEREMDDETVSIARTLLTG